jgi:hypothetical protein
MEVSLYQEQAMEGALVCMVEYPELAGESMGETQMADTCSRCLSG